MSDDTEEGKLFRSFERRDEFISLQNTLLALDLTAEPILEENRVECDGLRKLSMIVCLFVDNVS